MRGRLAAFTLGTTLAAATLAAGVSSASGDAPSTAPQLVSGTSRASADAVGFTLRLRGASEYFQLVPPAYSLCIRIAGAAVGRRERRICVAAAGTGLVLRLGPTGGSQVPGAVRQSGQDRLLVTLPVRRGALYDGRLRWQAVLTTRGPGCPASRGCESAPAQAGGVVVVHRLRLMAPLRRALGARLGLVGEGAAPGTRVLIEQRRGSRWLAVGAAVSDGGARFRFEWRRPPVRSRLVVRARVAGGAGTTPIRVRTRTITLASVGDINLGDGVGAIMGTLGPKYPWFGVARTLRRADVAFGNLECSVSSRGRAVVKAFTFRGPPPWLRVVHNFAGLDVVNLANNHTGDYGPLAAADTVRWVRRSKMLGVGAGYSARDAARPRVIERLGLRIAFVGFSDIGPRWFAAGGHSPGTQFASFGAIQRGVAAARRVGDVVIATFHWGVERSTTPTGRQAAFAKAALDAGATAVIAAHPHVLQPIVRPRRHRLIAYSLGNFVWAAGSGFTARTGILTLQLSTRGVEHAAFRRATIVNTQPRLAR